MSTDKSDQPTIKGGQVLIAALVGVIIVLGFAIALQAINQSSKDTTEAESGEVNVLANSDDDCVQCHENTTPGIVDQYGHSSMAAAEVSCQDCHEVESDYPGSVEHEGTFVLNQPTTAMCQDCHTAEVAQYNASRHGLPAYVAVYGSEILSSDLLEVYSAIPEGGYNPEAFRARNALADIEGPEVRRFACEGCHDIGAPAADGSVGQCQDCHTRHEFSLEQARKPETCNACHIGPDHPQWEIYQESGHGIAYMTDGDTWNWEAEPGTLSVEDFPAPTCATCHMSGFGGTGTTHDVGDRLTWFLAPPISTRRPAWEDNMVRMQSVCTECHNQNFIDEFYTDADALVGRINEIVVYSDEIMAQMQEAGLTTEQPFDEPLDFVYFNLWHHWGRTAKFGAWMQGPDYTQWHGAYEMLHELAEMREIAREELEAAGYEYIEPMPEYQESEE